MLYCSREWRWKRTERCGASRVEKRDQRMTVRKRLQFKLLLLLLAGLLCAVLAGCPSQSGDNGGGFSINISFDGGSGNPDGGLSGTIVWNW